MALKSSFRYRRLKKSQIKVKEKLISFYFGNQCFALPISAAIKVILAAEVKEKIQQDNLTIIKYQGQEVFVVDIESYIFPDKSKLTLNGNNETSAEEYYVFMQSQQGEIIAFSIYSTPSILLSEKSAIKPIPQRYLEKYNIDLVSSKMIQLPNNPITFLLEPNLLVENMASI